MLILFLNFILLFIAVCCLTLFLVLEVNEVRHEHISHLNIYDIYELQQTLVQQNNLNQDYSESEESSSESEESGYTEEYSSDSVSDFSN